MNHRNNTLALVLSTLFASTGFAQTATSGPATQPNSGAAQTQPATPAFNPNSNPNPNPANPDGNPPTPIANPATNPAGNPPTNPGAVAINPAGAPATNPAGTPATNPGGPAATNPAGTSMSPVTGSTALQPRPGATVTSSQVFSSLDPGKKGYLSTADVASNKFLASNFQHCDTNADGKLTQAEVTLCMQSVPPGMQ
jgi:hypothetical protein